jgi:hypothetical protein
MSGINPSIVRYAHTENEYAYTEGLITCFQDVFADRPWNEWRKCAVCEKYWGTKDKRELEALEFFHCGEKVLEYWPSAQVRSDLDNEISAESSCWLALEKASVIGFCWGYEATLDYLEERLALPFRDAVFSQFGQNHRIAYQDELGVLGSCRGRNIAKSLFTHRHKDFVSQGLTLGIVRTRKSPESSVTYLWFTEKLGYKVLAEYPGEDGRVVLGQTLDKINFLLE